MRVLQIPLIHQTCRNCEYFDVGAMDKDGHADCYNRLSDRFQTQAARTCLHWTIASELWGDIVETGGSA